MINGLFEDMSEVLKFWLSSLYEIAIKLLLLEYEYEFCFSIYPERCMIQFSVF